MSIIQQDWLNSNSYRSYPIKESCSRMAWVSEAFSREIVIPDNMLVDMVLSVGTNDPDIRVYISDVVLVGGFLSLAFKDASEAAVATLAVDLSGHTAFDSYPVVGVGAYEDTAGRVTLGDLSDISEHFPEGNFQFKLVSAELEPSIIRPDIRTVSSIQSDNAGELGPVLYGHVRLVAGENIRLTPLPELNAIKIDAIDATGFEDACECDDAFTAKCINAINGVDVSDVQIVGDKCIEVEVSGNQIKLVDKCSQPCCGCVELEFLSRNLDTLQDQLSRLETYETEIRDKLINFITNVLTSV